MHSRFVAEGKPARYAQRREYSTGTTADFAPLHTFTTWSDCDGNHWQPHAHGRSTNSPAGSCHTGDEPFRSAADLALRQSIEYSMTANRAVLDLASSTARISFQHLSDGRNSISVQQRFVDGDAQAHRAMKEAASKRSPSRRPRWTARRRC